MKVLDAEIDNQTEAKRRKSVIELAELRIRNLDAFRELKELNDTGDFLYKHTLIKEYSFVAKIRLLKSQDPAQFEIDFLNALGNVRRYKSYSKSPTFTADQQVAYKQNLADWTEKHKLYQEVNRET